jgi:hypothetical protein
MPRKTTRKYSPLDFKFTKADYDEMKQIPLYQKTAFECCRGWFGILYDLGHKINAYCLENKINPPRMQQVKEKFGTLRFYYAWQDDGATEYQKDIVRDWVSTAEKQTETTCEYCGKDGELMVDDGVWKVTCPEHTDDHEYVYTAEEYTKIREEQARKMRKCDVCGEGYADGYNNGETFVNRCEKHKEDFITTEEYWSNLQKQKQAESESV